MPLRTKVAVYFNFNTENMPIWLQVRRRNLASPRQTLQVLRIQRQKLWQFRPRPNHACLNPSATLPFRLRVYRTYAETETMRVRTKLAVYFDFNTETMQFSSQVVSTSFWVARARAYTLEVIHTHLYQRTVHNSSLQTHNSTQFAAFGVFDFNSPQTQFIQIDYVRAFNEYANRVCFDFGIFPPAIPAPSRRERATRAQSTPPLPTCISPLYSRCGPSRARIAPLIWRQRVSSPWRAETPLSALLALTGAEEGGDGESESPYSPDVRLFK
ncbi:hypothetical protein R3P38DRAFT_3284238 [Favolaschia claudopus]|uniref:Uncharacterized protein n=1 Tax=Favolaschia claudopus TaxID=2862362 RepID=A0AAW0A5H1_9AGAR